RSLSRALTGPRRAFARAVRAHGQRRSCYATQPREPSARLYFPACLTAPLFFQVTCNGFRGFGRTRTRRTRTEVAARERIDDSGRRRTGSGPDFRLATMAFASCPPRSG